MSVSSFSSELDEDKRNCIFRFFFLGTAFFLCLDIFAALCSTIAIFSWEVNKVATAFDRFAVENSLGVGLILSKIFSGVKSEFSSNGVVQMGLRSLKHWYYETVMVRHYWLPGLLQYSFHESSYLQCLFLQWAFSGFLESVFVI